MSHKWRLAVTGEADQHVARGVTYLGSLRLLLSLDTTAGRNV